MMSTPRFLATVSAKRLIAPALVKAAILYGERKASARRTPEKYRVISDSHRMYSFKSSNSFLAFLFSHSCFIASIKMQALSSVQSPDTENFR